MMPRIRKARAGEAPTHLASESIEENEAVVADMRARNVPVRSVGNDMTRHVPIRVQRQEVHALFIGIDVARPGAEKTLFPRNRPHEDMVDATRYAMDSRLTPGYHEKKALRSERRWTWVILVIGVPFLLFALYRFGDSLAAYINGI